MMRPGKARPRAAARRPAVEVLEGRSMMASGFAFQSALGLGATGASGVSPQIRADAVAVDPAGDTFVTGSFRGTVGFDPSSSSSTFNSGNNLNTFVVKYTPAGALAWVKVFSGRAVNRPGVGTVYSTGQGSALAVDGSGNVLVAGSFSGAYDLDGPSGVVTLNSPSGTQAFVARFDGSGNLGWAVSSGGAGLGDLDEAFGLAPDGSGGAIIAGSYTNAATFGGFGLQAGGSSEAFAARVDGAGRFAWAASTRGSGSSTAKAGGVAVDASGNVVLAGSFSGSVAFGTATGTAALASAGSTDAAVWKLGPTGALAWARRLGSIDFDSADAVAVDAPGNVYAGGTFSGAVDFGTGGRADVLTSGPVFNAFATRLDPSGSETWARGLVGPGWSKGQGIGVDAAGVVHLAGTFSGSVDFDPGPAALNLASSGSTDVFAAGLDGSGNLAYALQAGRQNANVALGLAVDASGRVAIAGTYTGPIAFGTTTLPAIGASSAFVARLAAPPPPAAPSAPILQAASDTGASPADGVTSATSPSFDVATAGASNTVQLLRDGVAVASRVGPGPIRDPGPLADGTYAYTARQVDASSTAGPASPSTSVTVATRPPSAPSAAPGLLAADDTGAPGDGITSSRQPRLVGPAPAGLTVQLVDASGTVYGSAARGSDGSYSIRPSVLLADGTYSLGVRAVDLAGNVGAAGPRFALTVDATPPAAVGALSLLGADDSGTPGDGLTNVRTPRLAGLAEARSTVQLVDGSLKVYATATAAGDGSFTALVGPALAEGSYVLRGRAIDAAGNVGALGPAFTLAIRTTPPASPATPGLLAADDSGTIGDRITSVARPRLTGSSAPGVAVQLLGATNAVLGSAVASSSGAYTVSPTAALADGTYALRVVAVDAAGNASLPGGASTLTILATPPAKPAPPSILGADDTGVVGDGLTAVRAPRLAGLAAPNARVEWVGPTGSVVASTTSDVSGSYQFPRGSALASGTYSVRVRAVDVAGNVGPLGDPLRLVIRVAAADTLGAGRTELALYNQSTALYSIGRPAGPADLVKAFGIPGDVPVTGDFFGTGHASQAVYRPSSSTFVASDVVTQDFARVQLGQPGDVPAPADYDGDGRADYAVYRPSNATFTVLYSSTGTTVSKVFGIVGDIPAPADYFGTGHASMAVYRPGTSTFVASDLVTLDFVRVQVGNPGDVPVPADYEGIGRADFATYRPSTSTFTIALAGSSTPYVRAFGIPGDIPAPGDYFGTGQAALAVYRPGSSTFVAGDLNGPNFQRTTFGQAGPNRPVLAPITTWFRFGTGTAPPIGTPAAASASGGPAPTPVPMASAASPAVVAFIPLEPAKPPKPKAGPAGASSG